MHAVDVDGNLVERAVTGDRTALKLLLTGGYERLRGFVFLKLPPDLNPVLDPDDIVQDTHVEVFQRIKNFRPQGPDSFFRWTATIAVNRVRTMLRHYHAAKRGGANGLVRRAGWTVEDSSVALLDAVAATSNTPSRSAARREAVIVVQAAVCRLPDRHHHAVRLVYLQGITVREAARRLGCTDRAIQGLCRRGLRILANELTGPLPPASLAC